MTDLSPLLSAAAPMTLASAPQGFLPLLMSDLARLAAGRGARAVYVASDDNAMRALADAARWFAPDIDIIAFPAWDCLPYDRASPSLRIMAERLAALHALGTEPERPQLLVTTVNAATQRTLTPFRLRQLAATLAPGERIEFDKLIMLLQGQGYVRTDTVADAGEFAVRGSIIDLFPSGEEEGLRLDFFGDEIETVRRFDPTDQRTTGNVERFDLLPASEALLEEDTIRRFRTGYRELFGATATGDPLYQAISEGRRLAGMEHWLPLFEERLDTLFDHLGDEAVIVRDHGTPAAAEARFGAIEDYFGNRKAALGGDPGSFRPLDPETLYLPADDWATRIERRPLHIASPFREPDNDHVVDFGAQAARDFAPERKGDANVYRAIADHVAELRQSGKKVVLGSYSEGARNRFSGLMAEHGLQVEHGANSWSDAQSHDLSHAIVPLDHGFTAGNIAVFTEQDMLGDRLRRRTRRKKDADAFLNELATLSPGDFVVHTEHGIGRYEGLISIPVGDAPHDCVALEYAGGDKLYVPVENLDVLSRYGASEGMVSLDRLGGEGWQRRKAKMKDRIHEIAGELIATAAKRALREAESALPDSDYAQFVDRFPYAETDDQERAIGDVVADLGKGKPMDRLVCGDVGFGKTEVALRAAYVAAMSGMQVAIVCPTTLLARQHYTNFTERFAGFPVEIGRLSRLVPAAEAKATREGLASGNVDIVIGTHAILAKSVDFKRLGLVIVDEEQHFGVTHKERLKALKADVHVLTLTATPIPRTLQMAMSGLRELSVIQTPPIDRLAVRTYVMPWDPVVLREALLREHYRGGQSFFVAPRIADLPEIEEYLREHVPEISFVIAHGQMPPTQVEERMSAFYDRKYDVLLSTTIVESGLDIPSANTLIIHRADMFGLAQLYQLRGRVGRSKERAYAYMTTPANRVVTEAAQKRLSVLSDLETLGAGFQLASHDLDQRGAGNLLGDEQSGHIKEVGFELYQSMLEDAIVAAKAGDAGIEASSRDLSPQISVDAPILIPEDYVPDLDLRMALYRRMNGLEDRQEVEAFAAELIDRFGKLPLPTENLLRVIEAKLNAKKANVAKIDAGPRGALVTFFQDRVPDPAGLIAYVERIGKTARLRPDHKLVITRNWGDPQARLNGILQLSKGLSKAAG
ncbi:MAG: transcription-repair coupling factor [Parasphingopyxis sp.]|uniref:transcription-repair coupling factor n=1 Tax=Parasphingopyxis sp. TaxID=1920299 RepID=UPI0032EEB793